MHFTAAHEELRLQIRRCMEKEVAPHLEEWEETLFPNSIIKRFGDLGFLGLRYPPEYGGQGGDYFSAVVLSEEMARVHCGGLGMAIAVQTEMATPPVARFGSEEQKRRFLVPAIAGDAIAAIAMTEPDAGSDLAGMRTTARRAGNEYVINGRKTFITNGRRCQWCLLVTKTDTEVGHKGFSLFLVPKDTPGFHVARTLKKLGMHSSDTAELVFEDCRVPVEFRLDGADVGAPGRAADRRLRSGRERPGDLRVRDAVRKGPGRVRPADRPVPGGQAPAGGHGQQDRRGPGAGLRDMRKVGAGRVPGARDLAGQAARLTGRRRGGGRGDPDPRRPRLHGRVPGRARL